MKYFIGGNWKCNGTKASVKTLVEIYNSAGDFPVSSEVTIAPPTLHISYCQDNCRSDISICAQNISTDVGFGAMTGELTGELFNSWGVLWTLTGHSERRRRLETRDKGHNEHDMSVADKTAHALSCDMSVILCVGETLQNRESGNTLEIVFQQVSERTERAFWKTSILASHY